MSQILSVVAVSTDDLKLIRNQLRRKFNRNSFEIRSEYKRTMDAYCDAIKIAINCGLPFETADDYEYEFRLASFAYEKAMVDHIAENILCDENFKSDYEEELVKIWGGFDINRKDNTRLLISILDDLHKRYEPSWGEK